MTIKYKTGDRVRISKSGEADFTFYDNTVNNPFGMNGEIVSVQGQDHFMYNVRWENGDLNRYREVHLDLIEA